MSRDEGHNIDDKSDNGDEGNDDKSESDEHTSEREHRGRSQGTSVDHTQNGIPDQAQESAVDHLQDNVSGMTFNKAARLSVNDSSITVANKIHQTNLVKTKKLKCTKLRVSQANFPTGERISGVTLCWHTPPKSKHGSVLGHEVTIYSDREDYLYRKSAGNKDKHKVPPQTLLSGSKYTFYVRTTVKNKDGTRDIFESEDRKFFTSIAKPTGISVTCNEIEAEIKWSKPPKGADKFKIRITNKSGFSHTQETQDDRETCLCKLDDKGILFGHLPLKSLL